MYASLFLTDLFLRKTCNTYSDAVWINRAAVYIAVYEKKMRTVVYLRNGMNLGHSIMRNSYFPSLKYFQDMLNFFNILSIYMLVSCILTKKGINWATLQISYAGHQAIVNATRSDRDTGIQQADEENY